MAGMYRLKPWKDRLLKGWALRLARHGVTPDRITVAGLILGLTAALCLWRHSVTAGMVLLGFSLFADLLDGAAARAVGTGTIFGRYLDAGCDRIVELAWVSGLVLTGRIPGWGWLLPLGSMALLLARTYAFRRGFDTSFVIIARFERMAAMVAVALPIWHRLTDGIYGLVTVATWISVAWIILAVRKQTRASRVRTGLKSAA